MGVWHFLAQDWARYLRLREASVESRGAWSVSYGIDLPPDWAEFEVGAVFLPKQRELAEYLTQLAGSRIKSGGKVWVTGLIRSGARSLAPIIEGSLGKIAGAFSGRHSRLYLAERAGETEREKTMAEWIDWHQVETMGHCLKIAGLPGVFSQGRLDAGTSLLLETLREPERGRVLDFGCGCGVIGAALMKAWPMARVELTDSDAAAVVSARLTLEANGLESGNVRPSDAFSELSGRYDLIVSNPPFHSGAQIDWNVAETLARQAPAHLERRGRLRLVTNQFPHWRRLAQRTLGEPNVLARAGPFQVIEIPVSRSSSRSA